MLKHPELGGTDGFRGEATDQPGPGLMNAETVAGLSYSLVSLQQERGMDGPVVVGGDTRRSSEGLRQAAVTAVKALGAEVQDYGVAPTPMLQKIAGEVGAMALVDITASHNKHTDNGWKGMLGKKVGGKINIYKPDKAQSAEISDYYWNLVDAGFDFSRLAEAEDDASQPELSRDAYIDWVVADIERQFGPAVLAGKTLIIDAANGAVVGITSEVMRRLGADAKEMNFGQGLINDGCGAADLSSLSNFLLDNKSLADNPNFLGGLANDGDGDRMMALGVDNSRLVVEVTGNHTMLAMAGGQPGIVGTTYTNSGVVERLNQGGIGFEYCANGDSNVTEALLTKQAGGEGWTRGGEFTGHLIDTLWLPSGDGVRNAAWLAAWAASEGKTFGDIYEEMPMWPEVMKKLPLPKNIGKEIEQDGVYASLIQAAEDRLGQSGRLVVRPSGTEPLLRIWGEAKSEQQINEVVDRLQAGIGARLEQLK